MNKQVIVASKPVGSQCNNVYCHCSSNYNGFSNWKRIV